MGSHILIDGSRCAFSIPYDIISSLLLCTQPTYVSLLLLDPFAIPFVEIGVNWGPCAMWYLFKFYSYVLCGDLVV
jgi:hypothetical protein